MREYTHFRLVKHYSYQIHFYPLFNNTAVNTSLILDETI